MANAAAGTAVAGLTEAGAGAAPPIPDSINPTADTLDFNVTGAQASEHVKRAKLHAAVVRIVLAYVNHLARHPRTLAAGLLVAVAQFFLLMLVNGRITLSEPTAAGAMATQNQVAGGDWLPASLEPDAAEAPKWTAVTAPADAAPASSSADPVESPVLAPPADVPAAAPESNSTEAIPSASRGAGERLTIEQATSLMASRPKPLAASTIAPAHTPGVARLRGQIAPHTLHREPPTSSGQGTQP